LKTSNANSPPLFFEKKSEKKPKREKELRRKGDIG
jgi:hypothetical protein